MIVPRHGSERQSYRQAEELAGSRGAAVPLSSWPVLLCSVVCSVYLDRRGGQVLLISNYFVATAVVICNNNSAYEYFICKQLVLAAAGLDGFPKRTAPSAQRRFSNVPEVTLGCLVITRYLRTLSSSILRRILHFKVRQQTEHRCERDRRRD